MWLMPPATRKKGSFKDQDAQALPKEEYSQQLATGAGCLRRGAETSDADEVANGEGYSYASPLDARAAPAHALRGCAGQVLRPFELHAIKP